MTKKVLLYATISAISISLLACNPYTQHYHSFNNAVGTLPKNVKTYNLGTYKTHSSELNRYIVIEMGLLGYDLLGVSGFETSGGIEKNAMVAHAKTIGAHHVIFYTTDERTASRVYDDTINIKKHGRGSASIYGDLSAILYGDYTENTEITVPQTYTVSVTGIMAMFFRRDDAPDRQKMAESFRQMSSKQRREWIEENSNRESKLPFGIE